MNRTGKRLLGTTQRHEKKFRQILGHPLCPGKGSCIVDKSIRHGDESIVQMVNAKRRSEVIPTLRDVAKAAGVSPSTASVVLSGTTSTTRVSEETRKRIHDASFTLGYRPNLLARSLRNQATAMIGVYWGYREETVRNLFVSEVVAGIQHAANDKEHDIVLFGSFRGKDTERLATTLLSGKVDGVVLIAPMDDPLAELLAPSFVPVVAAVNTLPGIHSVTVDDVEGMTSIARYIHAKGHRKVLYRHRLTVTSACERFLAFHGTAQELGIEVLDGYTDDHQDSLSEDEIRILSLPSGERPTAVVCWHDISAHVVMEYCFNHNISVPDELAVTGFNGQIPPIRMAYRLTTIAAPWWEAGCQSANIICDLISGRTVPMEHKLPVSLFIGDTA